MESLNNKWLKVGKSVILTPSIDAVIVRLDPYFENHQSFVTSGLRDSDKQLNIIRGYLASKGLDKTYRDTIEKGVDDMINYDGKQIYSWQLGWSALLNCGIIINPPKPAELLMDYIGKDGKNKKGTIFQMTPHANGSCFDVGGGADGISGNATNELAIIEKAKADGIEGLESIVIEHANNCVHCQCKLIHNQPTLTTTTTT